MTSAATAPHRADGESLIGRRLRRVPIWVKISVVTVLVLLGVLLTSMLLGGSGLADRSPGGEHGREMPTDGGSGGQHGTDDRSPGGDHGSGNDRTRGGGHGTDDQPE